jgi:vitamin B12 transporter
VKTTQTKIAAALLCATSPLVFAATDNMLDEIVVTATRIEQPLNQSLSSTSVITQQDIRNSQAADVPTLLRTLAGVEFYQSGGIGAQGSIFLRGANSNQVLVLLDGVRIGSATTGTTAVDQLMLDQIDHIEVVRGNVSSLYGSEAIGGVIQIFTRHGKGEPSFNVSGGGGSHHAQRLSAGFGGEAGNTEFDVQASGFRTDGVSAIKPGFVPTINPDNDGYDNTSLSGSVRHRFDADNSLAVSVFRSQGHTQYDDPYALSTDANISKSTLGKFSVVSDNRFGDSWQSRLQLAQGTDESRDYLNGTQNSSIRTNNRQVGWQNTLFVNASGSILLGLEHLNQQVASDTAYSQTARRVNSLYAGYTGSYGAHEIQANIRQDHYSDFGTANTWLLGYGHALGDAWRVTASISTAFKAPTFNDMYGPVSWGSNPGLKPERSRDGEIGLHYAADGQNMNMVYFDNRTSDLIVYQWPAGMVNLDQARNNGIEFTWSRQFGDTGVKAALTSQDPRDSRSGAALLRRARLYGNLGVTRKSGAWQAGGEVQFSGSRDDIDINTYARTTLGGYSAVNLTARYAFNKHVDLALRADNLFNRDYMLAHGYNTPGRVLSATLSYR